MFYVNSEEELLEGQSIMKELTAGMEERGGGGVNYESDYRSIQTPLNSRFLPNECHILSVVTFEVDRPSRGITIA